MTQAILKTWDEQFGEATPHLSALSSEESRAGLVLLRELAKGEPVTGAQLAQALGITSTEAEAFLKETHFSPQIHADDVGRVIGFWGLSTAPTPHRFTLDNRQLGAWCAIDSLFLPELVQETARVESQDPETGERIRLTVSPDRIEDVEPEGVTVSLVRPETADLTSYAQTIATACHHIFFFASRESGERWVAKHPETILLSLDEAFALAKRQNARLFGQELPGTSTGGSPGALRDAGCETTSGSPRSASRRPYGGAP